MSTIYDEQLMVTWDPHNYETFEDQDEAIAFMNDLSKLVNPRLWQCSIYGWQPGRGSIEELDNESEASTV